MCLILTLFQVHPDYPLVVAANRDERRDRISTPPHQWEGEPAVWAGRDEAAGGTWLGVNTHGLVVGVTNRRVGENDLSRPSRGQLCLGALRHPSASAADAYVDEQLSTRTYNPFNLQCIDPGRGVVRDWLGRRWELSPGVHVLTNAGELDDVSVPVIQQVLTLLETVDLRAASLDRLMTALGTICADQGSDPPICRVGGEYGTVSSSLIAVQADGSVAAYWHASGPPVEHSYQPVPVRRSPVVHSH